MVTNCVSRICLRRPTRTICAVCSLRSATWCTCPSRDRQNAATRHAPHSSVSRLTTRSYSDSDSMCSIDPNAGVRVCYAGHPRSCRARHSGSERLRLLSSQPEGRLGVTACFRLLIFLRVVLNCVSRSMYLSCWFCLDQRMGWVWNFEYSFWFR